jgi:tetratricopeptide (TPR) repeat protein
MHSVFRIGQINQLDIDNNRLWQVELILNKDNDPQIHILTEFIREETLPTAKGWYRLGALLIQLGKFGKAQQVYKVLFDQVSDEYEKMAVYHMLEIANEGHGKYAEAITFYEKSIEIEQTIQSQNDPNLAASYTSMAVVYSKMGEYMKSLSFHKKALEIFKQVLSSNDKNGQGFGIPSIFSACH